MTRGSFSNPESLGWANDWKAIDFDNLLGSEVLDINMPRGARARGGGGLGVAAGGEVLGEDFWRVLGSLGDEDGGAVTPGEAPELDFDRILASSGDSDKDLGGAPGRPELARRLKDFAARAVGGVSEFLRHPFGVKSREGDATTTEERKNFFAGFSEMGRKAKEMLGGAQSKAKNWFGGLRKGKPAEGGSRLSLKEKIEVWRPKVTREQAGKFLEVHGVNAISFAIGAIAGAEYGQNAPMVLEAAGMTMFALGQMGLMIGKERGVAEIVDTESKFRRVASAIQRACSNSDVRMGLRVLRSGGAGLAVATVPDVLRHLAGAEAAVQAQASPQFGGLSDLVIEHGRQAVDQAAQQARQAQASPQFGGLSDLVIEHGRQAVDQAAQRAEQAAQQAAQMAEAAREGSRVLAERIAQQADTLVRTTAEQAAQQQQAMVDALRAGRTMAEMAQNMPRGTAHEAAYQVLSRIPDLHGHVGEATQTILNGLRAKYGEARGLDIFSRMTRNELRAAGEYLAGEFAGVPKGGLPIDHPGARDVLQAGNISWQQAGEVASRVWDKILTAKPMLKLALGLG